MKKQIFFLVVVVLLASFLRLWKLGVVPPSPNWDEVALGYNAYSILLTGKDEYGKVLPFVLRSYDDYKPALYAYLIIPFIKIYGLDVFAVRLPSALFGIVAVLGTYFLVKEFFAGKKQFLPLLSATLLAISPWHIQFSRIAFESNVGMSLHVLGALFFMKGLKKPIFLFLSSIIFALNLYVYQSNKVFTPLLVFALVIIYRKELFSLSKKIIVSVVLVGIIIALPMALYVLTSKEALSRAQGVSVFSDTTVFLSENVGRLAVDKQRGDLLGMIVDNRRVLYIKEIISGYIVHFDLNWLFTKGDISRHHAPNMGLLYLWELPFLLIGIYTLIFGLEKDNVSKKAKICILAWFLMAPIPASITSGVPHAVRTLNFLPMFQVFIAFGIIASASAIAKLRIKYILVIFYSLFIIFNFLYYISQYFVQQNYFVSADWQYGYKEAISEVKKIDSKYTKIVISNKPHLDQSYMFFLFYLQYPPSVYHKEAQYSSGGFRENHHFGKYDFRPIVWDEEVKSKQTLFIGRYLDFPENDLGHVKTVYFLNGKPAIKMVEGQ